MKRIQNIVGKLLLVILIINLLSIVAITPLSRSATYKQDGPWTKCGDLKCLSLALRRTYKIRAETIYDPVIINIYVAGQAINTDGSREGIADPTFFIILYPPSDDGDIVINVLEDRIKLYADSEQENDLGDAIIKMLLDLIAQAISSRLGIPIPSIANYLEERSTSNIDIDDIDYFKLITAVATCECSITSCRSPIGGGVFISFSPEIEEGAPEEHYYGWYDYYLSMMILDDCSAPFNAYSHGIEVPYGTCVFSESPDIDCPQPNGGVPSCPTCPVPTSTQYYDTDH